MSFSNWNSQNLTAGRSNILGSILATYRACLAVALLMLDYANAGFSRLPYFKQWFWGDNHPECLQMMNEMAKVKGNIYFADDVKPVKVTKAARLA